MIDLELYRIFAIVANEKNLTKASNILNISQPAVTKHIKNLEAQLQINLFKRNKYGVELTKEGNEIYDIVKEPINILVNVEKKYGESKDINLGAHITMLSRMFSECIGKYYTDHDNSKVNVINENSDVMLSMLENLELDIVLSKKLGSILVNTDKIKFISLGYLQDAFVVNNNSELLNRTMTKEDIKKEVIYTPRKSSITTINLMNTLELKDEEASNIKNMTYTTMLGIIKAGKGIGIITKEFIKDELKEKKISILKTDFKLPNIEYGIYVNKSNLYKEVKDLIDIIKNESNKN